MGILDLLGRIVSILVGLVTLAEKGSAYIRNKKERTAKDPSACLAAPDGSKDDCESNR